MSIKKFWHSTFAGGIKYRLTIETIFVYQQWGYMSETMQDDDVQWFNVHLKAD